MIRRNPAEETTLAHKKPSEPTEETPSPHTSKIPAITPARSGGGNTNNFRILYATETGTAKQKGEANLSFAMANPNPNCAAPTKPVKQSVSSDSNDGGNDDHVGGHCKYDSDDWNDDEFDRDGGDHLRW